MSDSMSPLPAGDARRHEEEDGVQLAAAARCFHPQISIYIIKDRNTVIA